jgi:hypothetical protein
MTKDISPNTLNTINNTFLLKLHTGIIMTTFFQIFTFFNYNKDLSLYFLIISNIVIFLYFSFLYKKFSNEKERLKEFLTTFILSSIFTFSLFKILISHDLFFIQIYIYFISLSIYHFSEYAFVCVFHPDKLGFNSK